MTASSQRAIARVFAARGFAWQDESSPDNAEEGIPVLDDEGQVVGYIERPEESERPEFSVLDDIAPLAAGERSELLRALEHAESRLIHTLLTTIDEAQEQWLMAADARIDSNKSTTLEREDLSGLSRRERAEISMRVAQAVLAEEIDFGVGVRAMINRMLELRRRLFADSLRLVVSFVLKRGQRLERTTGILRGALGLDKAIDRFESERGNAFSTYASWWVRHSVCRSETDFNAALRIPVHAAEEAVRYWRTQQQLWARAGVRPRPEEVLAEMGSKYTLQRLGAYRRRAAIAWLGGSARPGAAEDLLDADIPSTLEGGLSSTWVAVAMAAFAGHVAAYEASARGDRHSREIFNQRIVPKAANRAALRELGAEFGVSRERVRQLESMLLEKLKLRLIGKKVDVPPWRWSPAE